MVAILGYLRAFLQVEAESPNEKTKMTTNKKQTANREITKKKKRKDSKKVGVRVRASHSGLAFSTSHPHREVPHPLWIWRGLLYPTIDKHRPHRTPGFARFNAELIFLT